RGRTSTHAGRVTGSTDGRDRGPRRVVESNEGLAPRPDHARGKYRNERASPAEPRGRSASLCASFAPWKARSRLIRLERRTAAAPISVGSAPAGNWDCIAARLTER